MSVFQDDDTNGNAQYIQEVHQRVSQGIKVNLKNAVMDQLGDSIVHDKRFKRLLRHTHHCWTVLTLKRLSLRLALDVLRNEIWPETWRRLSFTRSLAEVEALLQNLFLNWLRVKDGLILVTSGECRHEGDIQQSANSRFKSNLNKNTKTFKAELTYNAAAWDEWNDPAVGLLGQWKELCRKPSVWKAILRQAKLDFLRNTAGGDIQGDFNDMKWKILEKLRIQFKKADLRSDDKMEELKVSYQGTSLLFERRGKKFQIHDKDGVLPHTSQSGESLKVMWRKLMALPKAVAADDIPRMQSTTGQPATKRRVIALDEDDEDQSPKKKSKTFGLNVSKKESSGTVEMNSAQSLDEIKRQHGVNPNELADARETLENESQEGEDNTAMIEVAEYDVCHQEECEEKVKACQQRLISMRMLDVADKKRNLETKLNLQDSYREALVEAGNAYLWSRKYDSGQAVTMDVFQKQGRQKELDKARDMFQMALEIIEKQGKTLDLLELYDCENYEGQMLSRNDLELSTGRALANSGIVQIKVWEIKEKAIYLTRASENLEAAVDHASKISVRARRIWENHFRRGKPSEFQESIFVLLCEASELLCLVNRWQAIAQWHKKDYEESIAAFEKAASLINTLPGTINTNSEHHLKLRSDCFSCLTTAYDLMRRQLGRTSRAQFQSDTWRHGWFIAKMKSIIDLAAAASNTFESVVRKSVNQDYLVDEIMQEHDVLPSQELFHIRDRDIRWWNEKKQMLQQSISLVHRASIRGDAPNEESLPMGHFTVNVFGMRRRRNQKRRNAGGNKGRGGRIRPSNTNPGSSLNSQESSSAPKRKYRKWGDELLPHTRDPETGKPVLQLPFPCIPPTKMSAEVMEIAKRIGYPIPGSTS